jgi:predicted enzyme related to lactoylglutathione lyase
MEPVVDTAIIFTTRMDELAEFYRRAFGLGEPNEHGELHRGFPLDGFYLGFDQVEEAMASPGAVTLWFRVDDLEATFERMVALGASVRYPPTDKPWGDRLAAMYDPDGNIVGLSERR